MEKVVDILTGESHIVELVDDDQKKEVLFSPPSERIVGRKVKKWSSHCGTYGQGGPGFFGLLLYATDYYQEEWLILCIWGADDWITVNDQWLGAHPKYYELQKPLVSNFGKDLKWDHFSEMIIDQTISKFDIAEKSMKVVIGKALLSIDEDPTKRSVFAGTGTQRVLLKGDDLRKAWIIAPWPWVKI